MIIKTFDRGWGGQHEWKRFEISIIDTMLQAISMDSTRTVVINSVWYSGDMDRDVRAWLHDNAWDQIVLVAMLDAAIPKPQDFDQFARPVIGLGYYSGINHVDLCALWLAHKLDLASYGDLSEPASIDTAYMCLNRKPHWHRLKLFRQLEIHDLLDLGLVSLGQQSGTPIRIVKDDVEPDLVAPNSEVSHFGIPNNVCSLGSVSNWSKCFFNVVTETCWDINKHYFVSEKIYKPILGQRPFVVYDPDGGNQWLRDRGFETYSQDFGDISDNDPANPDQLALFLRDLCNQPVTYFRHKFVELRPKIKYNFANFKHYIKTQQSRVNAGLVTNNVV